MYIPLAGNALQLASTTDVASSVGRYVLLAAFGVIVFARIVLQFEHVHEVYGDDTASQESKINCLSCGARVPADADACGYCDESLTDEDQPSADETPDYGWIDD